MPTLATVASFLRKQTLPLLLVLGVILGLVAPAAGKAFANAHIDTFIVALIFFISGLSLRTQEIHTVWTLRLWGLLILFIVLFITPLCALFILEIPLEPKDLAIGLAVFSTAPTTLSTCVIFSRHAGGHWPLALAISISSNFLATFTVPYILKFLFDAVGQVELNPIDLLQKLALMILLPLTIGKLFQKIKSVSDFQTRNKERLSLMSGVGICFIPWIQLSESEESLKGVDVEHLAYVLLLCFGLHLCFLGIGFVTARKYEYEYSEFVIDDQYICICGCAWIVFERRDI
eukprot:TRINITY_DN3428_c0_g1_i11.p1 TRINITY_DN3428_c0_g1~~TRINITY_DN3428_c0_g1_i11.p1  ORF type:complete len:289 (+),score=45.82 TRINITY_DN3428_c0_g1_i11:44-910(+)